MYRVMVLTTFLLVSGCRDEDRLAPYLGPYYGGFDTALTADPNDDLNPNECARGEALELCRRSHRNPLNHLLLKLASNASGQLTLSFYRTQEAYESDQPIYLSEGCQTSLGPAQAYDFHNIDERLDDTQVFLTASFPLEFGRQILACTNSVRLSAGQKPSMDLSLQVNPVSGARAVSLVLEKSRRDGDYLYVKKNAERIPVKLDLEYLGQNAGEGRRLCASDGKSKIDNQGGDEAVCVITGRKKWRILLPISPFGPGLTAFWGATRSPEWHRSSGESDIVSYHRAIFVPVRFDAPRPDSTPEVDQHDG